MRKTKIVCTVGPSSDSEDKVASLIRAGADCFRLNFSHGTPEQHLESIKRIRDVSRKMKASIAIMQDLPGPKLRVGLLRQGSITLKKGQSIYLFDERIEEEEKGIPANFENLYPAVREGSLISLSDGTIRLKVISKEKGRILCKCLQGGQLLSGKGINLPSSSEGLSALTERDKKLLEFGLKYEVDAVAISFVKSSSDILLAKSLVKDSKKRPLVVAKIEKREALKDLHNIIKESDVVMVARGDLGVENPLEQVPLIQKQIINLCLENSKPVITATQILESMVNNPTPTRAEVTDIANAILDGTDALMLSEETAVGKYPVECVKVLDRVSRITESRMKGLRRFERVKKGDEEALTEAAVVLTEGLSAKAIIAMSDKPSFVAKVSRHRPSSLIIAPTEDEQRANQLRLVWGVIPQFIRRGMTSNELVKLAVHRLKLSKGSYIVTIGGAKGERSLSIMQS